VAFLSLEPFAVLGRATGDAGTLAAEASGLSSRPGRYRLIPFKSDRIAALLVRPNGLESMLPVKIIKHLYRIPDPQLKCLPPVLKLLLKIQQGFGFGSGFGGSVQSSRTRSPKRQPTSSSTGKGDHRPGRSFPEDFAWLRFFLICASELQD
jgi:hypothetical protein